jgi:hypothetical protein
MFRVGYCPRLLLSGKVNLDAAESLLITYR